MSNKQEKIEEIIGTDRKAFEGAIDVPGYKPGLKLPQSAYRYLLIPQRLLEIVDHPENVAVHAYSQWGLGLWGYVDYRRRFLPVDQRILQIHLVSQTGNERSPLLFVEEYTDTREYRGMGVAPSFYERLRECVIKMGYRFIYGFNTDSRTRTFFTEKLGRVFLGHTKPEIWELFSTGTGDSSWTHSLETMTIDFLKPEDRDEFIDPDPRKPYERWREYFFKRDFGL